MPDAADCSGVLLGFGDLGGEVRSSQRPLKPSDARSVQEDTEVVLKELRLCGPHPEDGRETALKIAHQQPDDETMLRVVEDKAEIREVRGGN